MASPEKESKEDASTKHRLARKFNKLRDKVDNLQSDISRLGIAVSTTWNPNHRHDEEWEKAIDSKLEAIRDSHRFRAFSPDRPGNIVKWHIDGHDYFWALSETIMILDWWLSPELQLRRPAAYFPEWRLDRLLKRKAEEGVSIYIQVQASMSLGSSHTKHALEDLHENISVMRHPDHDGGELVYYFSHHEKLCVADNKIAAMGGLDACFGRWDTRNHPLADVHPTQFFKALFPGQDYNNSRIMDFQNVQQFTSNALPVQEAARMPWHDTSLTIVGPSVVDLVQHFCERWNFVKKFKYKHNKRMEWLALPQPWDDVICATEAQTQAQHIANEEVAEKLNFRADHPHLSEWKEIGRRLIHPYHWPPIDGDSRDEPMPEGTCRVQVLRSAADWSHGVLLEDSIQQAYIALIREANHCIYIENQFCAALVERIVSAAKAGRPFKVFVVIPEVPAFPGDIQGQSGLKAIMEAQFRSINRGGQSIFEKVRAEGFDPNDYISFWNLRSYDRINTPWSKIKQMEEQSGISFHKAQVALARIHVGEKPDEADEDEVVYIEKPHDQSTQAEDTNKKKKTAQDAIPLPKTIDEAKSIIARFEQAAVHDDTGVSDNIGQHAMQSGKNVTDEPWAGTEEEERDCIVTELCYIHSKIMIVDDRRVIVGSANLNDRSQNGNHDSEIAICIEDTDMIETTMGGKKYMASKLAASWRRSLMREHLGLEAPQPPVDPRNQPTPAMQSAPVPVEYDWGSAEDQLVQDPLSVDFNRLWVETARENRQIFERIFRPVPNDMVRSWAAYKEYIGKNAGVKTGHVANPELSLQEIKTMLSRVRGHLVPMPINFLIEEKYMTEGDFLSVNPYTLAIYV